MEVKKKCVCFILKFFVRFLFGISFQTFSLTEIKKMSNMKIWWWELWFKYWNLLNYPSHSSLFAKKEHFKLNHCGWGCVRANSCQNNPNVIEISRAFLHQFVIVWPSNYTTFYITLSFFEKNVHSTKSGYCWHWSAQRKSHQTAVHAGEHWWGDHSKRWSVFQQLHNRSWWL